MAVEAIYRSTREPETLFMQRSLADAHDKMLEVAENLAAVFTHVLPHMSETDAENLGIFMSKRREHFAAAFKKSPESILELLRGEQSEQDNVVQLQQAG